MASDVTVPDPSILFRLSELRPTAQRLRELVALFAGWGYRALYLDWGDSFPWALDERFREPDAYREELVAGILREGRERGITVCSVFPGPDELRFAARVPSYRHLFRFESEKPILDVEEPAGRKLYNDLLDDFLRLLPEPGTLLVNWRGWPVELSSFMTALRLARESSVAVAVRWCEAGAPAPHALEALLELSSFVVVPEVGRPAEDGPTGDRIVTELGVRPAEKGEPANREADLAGTGRAVMISFDPDLCGRRSGHPAFRTAAREAAGSVENPSHALSGEQTGIVAETIEFSLEEVRSFGGSSFGDAVVERRSARETAERLAATTDEAWSSIRRVREAIAGGRPPGLGAEALRPLLAHIHDARAETEALAERLAEALSDRVDPGRLRRSIARRIAALDEEYHMLVGRLAAMSASGED